jgi:hypothetical protein
VNLPTITHGRLLAEYESAQSTWRLVGCQKVYGSESLNGKVDK